MDNGRHGEHLIVMGRSLVTRDDHVMRGTGEVCAKEATSCSSASRTTSRDSISLKMQTWDAKVRCLILETLFFGHLKTLSQLLYL